MRFLKISITIPAKQRVLSPLKVLVTRPSVPGGVLAEKICAAGGEALLLPLIEPRALLETQLAKSLVLDLDRYQKVIFISRPAARFGCELIERYWPQKPVGLSWFAIGAATAHELSDYEINPRFPLHGTDSEALLKLDDFDNVTGERILLVKGQGGRDLLSSELRKRNADVNELDVYQRHALDYTPTEVKKSLVKGGINSIVVTSGEIARRLSELVQLSDRLPMHLIVPSARVADVLRDQGFASIKVSDGAGDSAILESLQQLAIDVAADDSE